MLRSSPGMISQLNDYLKLEPNEKCFGLFYMGFHNEEPRLPKRTPMAEKVRWIND
ncbi:hypothetical protein [Pedobacter sp. NJ-S-72]